jgi:hypothetical protein
MVEYLSMGRKLFYFLAGTVIAGAFAWCCWDAFLPRTVAPHRGDGEFEDITLPVGPFAVSGYGISMPEFDLGEPFGAEYQVAGLTRLHAHCGVYLAIRDAPFDGHASGGELRLTITDSTGRIAVAVDGNLESFTCWSHGQELHGFYRQGSFFLPSAHETYRIKVHYVPCPSLLQYKGFVHLRCGGKL